MIENMATDEVIDRCLAAASLCMELGNDRKAKELMKTEFRLLAREVSQWHLSGESKVDLFLLPMEEELVQRHGQQVGRMLYFDFVDAFWIQTWIDLPIDHERMERHSSRMIDWHLRVQLVQGLRQQIISRHFMQDLSQN